MPKIYYNTLTYDVPDDIFVKISLPRHERKRERERERGGERVIDRGREKGETVSLSVTVEKRKRLRNPLYRFLLYSPVSFAGVVERGDALRKTPTRPCLEFYASAHLALKIILTFIRYVQRRAPIFARNILTFSIIARRFEIAMCKRISRILSRMKFSGSDALAKRRQSVELTQKHRIE